MIYPILAYIVYALIGYIVVKLLERLLDIPDSKDLATYTLCLLFWPLVVIAVAAILFLQTGGDEY